MKSVVITGVSSGIGFDLSLRLAEAGFHIFGTVRRDLDAEPLREAMGDRFTPLLLDVTDQEAIRSAEQLVRAKLGAEPLAGLVNNAGFATHGPLMHMPLQDLKQQFEVNVYGLYSVTQAFLPLLGASKKPIQPPGRIVNISSISGRRVPPFLGAYAASKYAVEALSDGFRRELAIYGIRVIVIEPGIVNTPIWDKRGDVSHYRTTDYWPYLEPAYNSTGITREQALPVAAVSRVVVGALLCPNPRLRYVMVPGGFVGRLRKWWIPRVLGDRWMDHRWKRALRASRRAQDT